ncbi:MAG: DinB family protein [Puia sp.]|nr:DinB family protein [Puia sp.]
MIFTTTRETAATLTDTIDQLSDSQYTKPCIALSGSSIGQHVRHIVELFQCLLNGYPNGEIDYDSRRRNQAIAMDREFAKECLQAITGKIAQPDKPLSLYVGFGKEEKPLAIPTTYFREIVYNIEHAIHHMALMRIGIHEVSEILLPKEFGVAAGTLKYQAECAR